MHLSPKLFVGPVVLVVTLLAIVVGRARQTPVVPSAAADSGIHRDFNDGKAFLVGALHEGATVSATVAPVGTVDTYAGTPSPALRLVADFTNAKSNARVIVATGRVNLRNTETNLAKLTLGFDLWVNQIRPVRVNIQSLDASGEVTSTRYAIVLPPVRDAYYRFNVDLDKTKPLYGKFDPKAPQIECFFELNDADGLVPRVADIELRVDNVSLSAPAFYVSETGSDKANGRSEKTAFATIQKAVDTAVAGDVILVMNGTYRNTNCNGVARIEKPGTPAAWIVIRACPGHKPQLVNDGWEVIKIVYIEVRGLTIRGNRPNVKLADALADGTMKTKNEVRYPGDPIYNGNGISIDGRNTEPANRSHHIRWIGNDVYDNCGAGLSAIASDYVTIEGNIVHENAYYMRYGGSGISFLNSYNFTSETSHRNFVINNHVYNNRCYVPWAQIGKISDGNGIIIDVNIDKKDATKSYVGRTLIANNVVHGSGGGGITITTSQGVDIIHNTVYRNVQSPELATAGWGDIFIGGRLPGSRDVTVYNNIVVADASHPRIMVSRASTDTTIRNNILFGGDARERPEKAVWENNSVADPMFVRGSLDPQAANFHLLPSSPAIGKAFADARLVPPYDFQFTARPRNMPATVGAYEFKK